jgi:hypothetical protein
MGSRQGHASRARAHRSGPLLAEQTRLSTTLPCLFSLDLCLQTPETVGSSPTLQARP